MNSTEKGSIGEEFVNQLAYSSFFEHWCYPGPRDETGDKKEICDLLILFGDTLIIVSVKNYEFKDMYERYLRRTIDKAVKQIYGAERKLFTSNRDIYIKHPQREVERFPKEKIKNIQRIIVNLGEGVRFYPFNQETIDDKFITVWDKEAFETIVRELDTIPDFLDYLQKREELFSGKSVTILPGEEYDFSPNTAAQFFQYAEKQFNPTEKQSILISGTEHDLLASFLKNEKKFPDNMRSRDVNGMFVQFDGNWAEFIQNKQVINKKELDKESYFLDDLVKREILSQKNAQSIELATALMSFNRFDRRVISKNFLQFFHSYKDMSGSKFARRYGDFNGIGIVFAFYPFELPRDRVDMLLDITIDSFSLYSNYASKSMILIATTNEFKQFKIGLLKDIVPFPKEKEEQVRNDVKLLGWFTKHDEVRVTEREYPDL
ncbi:hypothetical protein [Parachryseolinea silvisoli]|uniref:hypothetical protein n=1 Tax=Parachryseolinea silvisoli TaxID=2873601 RepID=UPI002265A51F|nr:hypothetical protein [Parachryseolinea silvisoli]MCD9014437.1 hypothetical protein [Parachryseolinea silvisoli]